MLICWYFKNKFSSLELALTWLGESEPETIDGFVWMQIFLYDLTNPNSDSGLCGRGLSGPDNASQRWPSYKLGLISVA